MYDEDKLREEAEKLIDRLRAMDPKGDDYEKVLNRLRIIQGILNDETERVNSEIELKINQKKLDAENEKIEVELQQDELKAKQSVKDKVFQVGFEVLKTILYVGGTVSVIFVSIMANNSGETLPSFANKFINGRKF